MCEDDSLTSTVTALLEFLYSEPFCRLLSHLTGLDLAENVIRITEEEEGEGEGEPCSSSATINTMNGRVDETGSEPTVCVYIGM